MIVHSDTNAWSEASKTLKENISYYSPMLRHAKATGRIREYTGQKRGATHANWSDDAGMNIVEEANVIKGIKEAFFPDQKVGVDLTAGEQLKRLGRKLLPEVSGQVPLVVGVEAVVSIVVGLRRVCRFSTFEINHVGPLHS